MLGPRTIFRPHFRIDLPVVALMGSAGFIKTPKCLIIAIKFTKLISSSPNKSRSCFCGCELHFSDRVLLIIKYEETCNWMMIIICIKKVCNTFLGEGNTKRKRLRFSGASGRCRSIAFNAKVEFSKKKKSSSLIPHLLWTACYLSLLCENCSSQAHQLEPYSFINTQYVHMLYNLNIVCIIFNRLFPPILTRSRFKLFMCDVVKIVDAWNFQTDSFKCHFCYWF